MPQMKPWADTFRRMTGPKETVLQPAAPKSRREWKYLTPHELRGMRNMLFAARTIVEGAYAGRHRSPFRGASPEFVDYREYNPGDEIRTIDWKAYGRCDRYFIRLFQKETDMNAYILLDRSASMGFGRAGSGDGLFGSKSLSKLEYGSYLAAALMFMMVKQGDKASLTLFDEIIHESMPPGGTFAHLYRALNTLEDLTPGKPTSLATVLRQAFGLFPRRGLLIIISDFLDDPQSIFAALNMYRHRQFEIILFHIMHPCERRLPEIDSVNFVDSESLAMIAARPGDIETSYEKAVSAFIEHMSASARARRIDYNLLSTESPYHEALTRYMHKRGGL